MADLQEHKTIAAIMPLMYMPQRWRLGKNYALVLSKNDPHL